MVIPTDVDRHRMLPIDVDALPALAASRMSRYFAQACVVAAGLLLLPLPLPARSAENDSP